MKLIDILVQELPKRGGWPREAAVFMQDGYGCVFYRPKNNLKMAIDIGKKFILAEDYSTCEVTREQYEAALKQSVWDGVDAPPVGVECECSWFKGAWLRCIVLFMSHEHVVVKLPTQEACYRLSNVEFRPIRSKRDEALEQMRKVVTNYNKTDVIHAIEQLYDAGYRKLSD